VQGTTIGDDCSEKTGELEVNVTAKAEKNYQDIDSWKTMQ